MTPLEAASGSSCLGSSDLKCSAVNLRCSMSKEHADHSYAAQFVRFLKPQFNLEQFTPLFDFSQSHLGLLLSVSRYYCSPPHVLYFFSPTCR